MWFTHHSLEYVLLLIIAVFALGENRKRILLNDPTYIQQQLDHLQAQIQSLQVESNAQKNIISSQQSTISTIQTNGGKGTYFTIWGRKTCPINITVVYSGYAGGSYYNDPGAAAEYICLPQDPIWGPHKEDTTEPQVAYMYGAEYQKSYTLWGMKTYDEDVPCTVCHTSQFFVTMMIPGRTQCYSGWTEAYHGMLASGSHGHAAASEYVCVDQHPEALAGGGNRNEDGKLFYPVKTKCGALKCPPYEDEKILSCVICMK